MKTKVNNRSREGVINLSLTPRGRTLATKIETVLGYSNTVAMVTALLNEKAERMIESGIVPGSFLYDTEDSTPPPHPQK